MNDSERRLLVTGATGYLGTWTLRHWQANHPDVTVWAASDRPRPSHVSAQHYCQVNLCDLEATQELIAQSRPTHVIHLAGLLRNASLSDYLAVNVVGTDHLYRALADARLRPDPRIVQAGSAAVYGLVRDDELPIGEGQPFRPVSDYALSKACQDQLAAAFAYGDRLPIIRARLFNLLGPGQPEDLVPMAFIGQLKRCAAGLSDRLDVGNTDPRRDFVDVRDVVEAMDLLLEGGQPGEAYNVGCGRDVSIREVIEELLAIADIDVPIVGSADRRRSVEVARVCADVSKIAAAVGWKPRITLRRSLEEMWQNVCRGDMPGST